MEFGALNVIHFSAGKILDSFIVVVSLGAIGSHAFLVKCCLGNVLRLARDLPVAHPLLKLQRWLAAGVGH